VHEHERPQPEAGGVVDDPRQDHSTRPTPALTVQSDTSILPHATTLADILRELVIILTGLKAVIDRKTPVERLAFRTDEVASSLGISRRAFERERSAGRFPAPDLYIGKVPLWRPETVRDWLDSRKVGRR
jgi:hypothetical protein